MPPKSHGPRSSQHPPTVVRRRPENFSTYVPRDVVKRLKLLAVLREEPLWLIVTDALEEYLERAEAGIGPLPSALRAQDSPPAKED